MKTKYLFLAIAVLIVVGGLWLIKSAWRQPNIGAGSATSRDADSGPNTAASSAKDSQASSGLDNRANSGQKINSPRQLAPPDPARKFWELTPEQRVERARHPVGG